MKTIEFKETGMRDSDNPTQILNYKDLIKFCINTPLERGFDIKTIRERTRILDALELAVKNNQEHVELEDADFKVLHNCVKQAKWTGLHKDIIIFYEYFEALTTENK